MRIRRSRTERPARRALAGGVGLAAALGLLGLLPAVAEAGGGGKPDLIPRDADQRGKPYGFRGERQDAKVKYAVKNTGKSKSHGVITVVYFLGGERIQGEGDLIRHKIKPGETARGTIRQELTDRPLPAGAYKLEICVDDPDYEEERNERNNCEVIKGSRFYSTYREWKGPVHGAQAGFGGSEQSWRSPAAAPASFGFDSYLGGGLFVWELTGGAVKFTTEGASGGCSYSGEATFVLERNGVQAGRVMANYATKTYTATATPISGSTYNVVRNCGGAIINIPTPVGFTPALFGLDQELPFGSKALKGAFGQGGRTYTWDLAGQRSR